MKGKNKSIETRKRLSDLAGKVRSELGEKAVDKQLVRAKFVRQLAKCHVMFLLDVSGSMASNDKLPRSKAGLLGFASDLGAQHETGLITFSDNARLIRRLSTRPMDNILPEINIEGGTVLAGAIKLAREELRHISTGRKIIVLVTDGCPGDRDQTISEAGLAKTSGIEVLAIATADADRAFLDSLVSSREFSVSVENDNLQVGFEHAARLLALPKP